MRSSSTEAVALLELVDRAAAREAVLEAVPERDRVLPELPAEEHFLAVAESREVDEALVGVLDLCAEAVDPVHALSDSLGLLGDLGLHARELARVEVAAVAGDRARQIRAAAEQRRDLLAVGDHPLRERADLGERFVRFLEREVLRRWHAEEGIRLGSAAVRRPAVEIFLWTRAAIWAAALLALLVFEPNRHPRADTWDDPAFTRDLGLVTDVWARWDSVWFLKIAEDGYGSIERAAAAFYPGYPALVAVLGRLLGGHYVTAGILISLAATLGAFVLLYGLARERLGDDGGRRAVLYLALFPMAFFLQAVYSEALFLLLSVAAFAAAERSRFLGAGMLAGLAILTRPAGFALLPALALLAWRSRWRGSAVASLAVAPALFLLYPLYLWHEVDDPLAFSDAQEIWTRHLSWAGPLGGIWDGLRAGWAGVRQLASGSDSHVYWSAVQNSDPDRVAALNLEALAFLVLFVYLTMVAWQRFGAPYGVFCAASLAIPLSVPSERWPLLSLPRFGLVVFPFFLALAWLGRSERLHTAILVVSALLLGVSVAQWALWQWVA